MRKIFLTAGHGGSDSGVIVGDVSESRVVTEFRNLVADKLKARGLTVGGLSLPIDKANLPDVVLDKDAKDRNLSLNLALKAKSMLPMDTLWIEFHCNAGTKAANGVECLTVDGGRLKKFAAQISRTIADASGIKVRVYTAELPGWKPDTAGQHHRLAVCRAGGVICELFFLTNAEDKAKYDKNVGDIAGRIADVIHAQAGVK